MRQKLTQPLTAAFLSPDNAEIILDTNQSMMLAATALTTFLISDISSYSTNLLVSTICFAAVCFKFAWLYYQSRKNGPGVLPETSPDLPLDLITQTTQNSYSQLPSRTLAIAGIQWALDLTSYAVTLVHALPVLGMVCAISIALIDVVKAIYTYQQTAKALALLKQSSPSVDHSRQQQALHIANHMAKVQVACAVILLSVTVVIIFSHPAAPVAALILCTVGLSLYLGKNYYHQRLIKRQQQGAQQKNRPLSKTHLVSSKYRSTAVHRLWKSARNMATKSYKTMRPLRALQ